MRFSLNLKAYNLYYFPKLSIDVKAEKKIKQFTHWRVKSLNTGNNFRCPQYLLIILVNGLGLDLCLQHTSNLSFSKRPFYLFICLFILKASRLPHESLLQPFTFIMSHADFRNALHGTCCV